MEPFDIDFDEILEELREIMKRMRVQDLGRMEENIRSGNLDGNWSIREINEPGMKGFTVKGNFRTAQPLETPGSFEPLEPPKRRPTPQRPSLLSDNSDRREPLVDIFEKENAIIVYVELPSEEKDNIKLNIVKDKVEVKTGKFYKLIDLPTENIETEKVSSRYNNGVLEVTIPRKETSAKNGTHRIKIE